MFHTKVVQENTHFMFSNLFFFFFFSKIVPFMRCGKIM